MRIETKTILTMHRHVISRNYRITLSHSEHRVYVLHIKHVQEEDRGSYMCQVNTVPMLSQIGYLDVVVPPDIIEELSSSDMFAREGTDVTLKCAARGRPEPKLSWRREDYKPVGAGNWQKNNLAQKQLALMDTKMWGGAAWVTLQFGLGC
ncbi:ig-like domain-containing protein [Trichonephila clavipes]|nr:ig-like domain-containing protein [Trichonephila clavipes]